MATFGKGIGGRTSGIAKLILAEQPKNYIILNKCKFDIRIEQ